MTNRISTFPVHLIHAPEEDLGNLKYHANIYTAAFQVSKSFTKMSSSPTHHHIFHKTITLLYLGALYKESNFRNRVAVFNVIEFIQCTPFPPPHQLTGLFPFTLKSLPEFLSDFVFTHTFSVPSFLLHFFFHISELHSLPWHNVRDTKEDLTTGEVCVC